MKLIEQYLTAVSYKLPFGRRKDIKTELRSLLMDELEDRFGPDAGEKEAEEVIRAFGNPSEVAARYRGSRAIIAESLYDTYFTLLKIVLFALSIAFSIIFLLKLIMDNPTGTELLIEIAKVPGSIIQGWLSATGLLTLIFIVLTRKFGDRIGEKELLDTSWSLEEIREIELENESPSVIGTIVSITLGGTFSLLVVIYPEIISHFEGLFERSGIGLGHHINIELFRYFAFGILALWIGSSIIELMMLRRGEKRETLRWGEAIINLLQTALFASLVLTPELYLPGSEVGSGAGPAGMAGSAGEAISTVEIIVQAPELVGFRLIFIIVTLASLGETIAWGVKKIRA